MAELKPFEVIMRIDYAASNGPEVVAHAKKVQDLVRCGECKHYNAGFECLVEGYGIERDPDWYCADGERKVQE